MTLAKRVKKPIPHASTATFVEIADALDEAKKRKEWLKEKKDGERKCDLCGKGYKPKRWWQLYCSDFCRVSAFQNKTANSEMKLLERVGDLEKENKELRKRVEELQNGR